ncbi:hypothetical protein [Streptomyces hokutonensis]|uniref:hypothetical protein n=1 Tax=Streptomyces hokutonensis TaxID=1306990 RepID=UPI0038026721
MHEVAEAAGVGVGKGTLFRRFGDRDGLLLALLGEAEADFHEAHTSGPPPLGPGAPARHRLTRVRQCPDRTGRRRRRLGRDAGPPGRPRTPVRLRDRAGLSPPRLNSPP